MSGRVKIKAHSFSSVLKKYTLRTDKSLMIAKAKVAIALAMLDPCLGFTLGRPAQPRVAVGRHARLALNPE